MNAEPLVIAFNNEENTYYSSHFKSPGGINHGTLVFGLTHHETILDKKTPIECTYLIFDY